MPGRSFPPSLAHQPVVTSAAADAGLRAQPVVHKLERCLRVVVQPAHHPLIDHVDETSRRTGGPLRARRGCSPISRRRVAVSGPAGLVLVEDVRRDGPRPTGRPIPASWYPDPNDPHAQMYWDGAGWVRQSRRPIAQPHIWPPMSPPIANAPNCTPRSWSACTTTVNQVSSSWTPRSCTIARSRRSKKPSPKYWPASWSRRLLPVEAGGCAISKQLTVQSLSIWAALLGVFVAPTNFGHRVGLFCRKHLSATVFHVLRS